MPGKKIPNLIRYWKRKKDARWKELEVGQVENKAACAHLEVRRFTITAEGRVFKEEWRCKDCGLEFFGMNFSLPSGKITIMEPTATLRDQFAMAAMLSDSIQSAVVAASYMGRGQTYSGEFPGMETNVVEYYKTADAMMKARL